MSGTAFYSGMAPGIASLMGSLADKTTEAKGLKYGADARKSMVDADKTAYELEELKRGAGDAQLGRLMSVAGQHGVGYDAVRKLHETAKSGGDINPIIAAMGDKANNVLRDLGAYSQKDPQHFSGYQKAMAEVPGVVADSSMATRAADLVASGKATPEALNMIGSARKGSQISLPNEQQLYTYMQGLPPAQQKQLMGMVGAMHPQPLPYAGDPTSGIVNRGTGAVVAPPQAKPQSQYQPAPWHQNPALRPGAAAPAPSQATQSPATSAAPAGLPPGAKKIGTSNGKAVYELPDGKRVREK